MTFDKRIIPALHELAEEMLSDAPFDGAPLYARLKMVVHYLDVLSHGQWARLSDDERPIFLRDMRADFNLRAWDSWLKPGGGAYDKVRELLNSTENIKN